VSSANSQDPLDEITLQDYGRVIWAGRRIILVAIIAAAIVGLALTFIRSTTYSASSQVYLGQETTLSGTPLTTPQTNPTIAPVVLEGDAIVDSVAESAGITPGRVRSGVSLEAPRAPGSAGNLPTLIKVTFVDKDPKVAKEVANLYAEQIRSANAESFETSVETYQGQIARAQKDIAQLERQVSQLGTQLAAVAGTPQGPGIQTALVIASQQLAESRSDLENAELGGACDCEGAPARTAPDRFGCHRAQFKFQRTPPGSYRRVCRFAWSPGGIDHRLHLAPAATRGCLVLRGDCSASAPQRPWCSSVAPRIHSPLASPPSPSVKAWRSPPGSRRMCRSEVASRCGTATPESLSRRRYAPSAPEPE